MKIADSQEKNMALHQAAEWFAILQDEHVKEVDFSQWKIWLDASHQHQAAWAQVASINAPFKRLTETGNPQAAKVALLRQAVESRRNALKLLGFGGTALFTGFMLKQYSPWRDWVTNVAAHTTTYQVVVGQPRLFTLAEGTKLWLNTNSQAKVAYSVALRRVTLHLGELLITSAKDHVEPARPLVVDTVHGRILAIGTRFTVRLMGQTTYVAVYEGAVSIAPAGSETVRTLNAGQQAQFTSQQILPIEAADKARETWTRGILLADNRRLDDFVAELARYRTDTLSVAPEIAHLRLMGAYPLKDTQRVLTSITEVLPVKLQQTQAGHTVIVKR